MVFAAVGKQELLYDMAMTVVRQRSIPLVSYVCDDYYYSCGDGSLIQRLRRKHLCGKIRELMRTTALTVTICQELTDGYTKTFGVNAETVMTCPVVHIRPYTTLETGSGRLVYMGNIEAGREQSLMDLGRVLDAENRALGTAYTLEIYTGNKYPEPLERLQPAPPSGSTVLSLEQRIRPPLTAPTPLSTWSPLTRKTETEFAIPFRQRSSNAWPAANRCWLTDQKTSPPWPTSSGMIVRAGMFPA